MANRRGAEGSATESSPPLRLTESGAAALESSNVLTPEQLRLMGRAAKRMVGHIDTSAVN